MLREVPENLTRRIEFAASLPTQVFDFVIWSLYVSGPFAPVAAA